CGFRPSPRAAFLRRQLDQIASLSAFYRKLNRMELAIPIALVQHTAQRARDLIAAAGALMPEPIPGYASRILDGNALSGTGRRLARAGSGGGATPASTLCGIGVRRGCGVRFGPATTPPVA